jgi:hypothetical protein
MPPGLFSHTLVILDDPGLMWCLARTTEVLWRGNSTILSGLSPLETGEGRHGFRSRSSSV